MDIDTIQKMFSEMGLGSSEERNKLVKELSINMIDNNYDNNVKIKTSTNTLISQHYAKLARYIKRNR